METAHDRAEVEQAGGTAGKQAEPVLEEVALLASSFDDVVSSVEKATGTPLTGPVRDFCRSAWHEYPRGVAMCASEAAMRPGVCKPNGLFVRMLRDGDHVRQEASLDTTAEVRNPGALRRAVEDGLGEL